VGGIDGIGAAAPRSTATEKVFQLSEKVSISSGRHFFTGGAALLHYNNDRYYAGNSGELGGFTFASFKDFLLGNPGTQSRGFGSPWTHVQDRVGLFAQDDWKVRSNLTVNLGLRWEYMSPLVEKNNRQVNYDLGGIQSGSDLPKDGSKPPSATGQAIFYKTIPADAHCENIPAGCATTDQRGLYDAYYGGISPRLGFAWTVNSKTIVRGAYGLVRYQEGTGGNNRLTQNSPFVPADLSGPWPAGRSLSQGFSEPLPGVGSGQVRYFADLVPQKTHQWNVFVERQLTGTMSLSAGYVGNRASNIMAFEFLNQSVPKPSLGEGNFNWDTPFAAVLPNVSFIRGTTSSGKSEYNGLQVALRQRRSKGLEFLASYTYGKALQDNNGFYGAGWSGNSNYTEHTGNQIGVQNVRNPDADWGPAFYDVRHNLSVSANYELPFARGKAWGGWNVSAVMSAHSGFPVTVREGSWWPLRSGTVPPGQERSDIVAGQEVNLKGDWSKPASDQGSRYLNINAFKQPAWGTYGNSPVGVGRGPGFFNVDMAVEKDFSLGGSRALAFRLEAFNVLNHANKGMPNNDRLDAANFGTITYVENSPRILEFAARFRF
jgi:hypothetical protein